MALMTKEFLHEVVARREGVSLSRRPRFSQVVDDAIRAEYERAQLELDEARRQAREFVATTPPYSYTATSSGTYGTVTMGHTITMPVVDSLDRFRATAEQVPHALVNIDGRLVSRTASYSRRGERAVLMIEDYPSVGITGRVETVVRDSGVICFDCPPNSSRRRNNVRIGNLPASMRGMDSFRTLARQALAMLIDHGCFPDYNLVVRVPVGDSIQTTFECATCAIHITIGE